MLELEKYIDTSSMTLEELKQHRYAQIDAKTGEFIGQGYDYPVASGNVFSLSKNAQINLMGLDNSKDDPAMVYPIIYNTINDEQTYSIPDASVLHDMYLRALGVKRSYLDSGTAIKDQIRAAANIAAVNAITDTR